MKNEYFIKTTFVTFLSFLLILAFSFSVAAQKQTTDKAVSRADLTGTWIYDSKNSSLGNLLDAGYNDLSLVIDHSEPELKIVKTQIRIGEIRSAALILYTDKRGEKNSPDPFHPRIEIESETVWEKEALVRSYKTRLFVNGKASGFVETIEEYKLSKDGKKLTIFVETRFPVESGLSKRPSLADKSKRIYRKKE